MTIICFRKACKQDIHRKKRITFLIIISVSHFVVCSDYGFVVTLLPHSKNALDLHLVMYLLSACLLCRPNQDWWHVHTGMKMTTNIKDTGAAILHWWHHLQLESVQCWWAFRSYRRSAHVNHGVTSHFYRNKYYRNIHLNKTIWTDRNHFGNI